VLSIHYVAIGVIGGLMPENPFDTVIRSRAFDMTVTIREKILYPLPLAVTQVMPSHPRLSPFQKHGSDGSAGIMHIIR